MRRQRSRAASRAPASGRARAPLVLAGDIGGTKTIIGLYEIRSRHPLRIARVEWERYPSREHSSLRRIVASFLSTRRARFRAAAFGIAGPVFRGRCVATNLPWVVDAASLGRWLGAPTALLNDLASTAHAIPHLGPSKLRVLNTGSPSGGGALGLIAAGTGLGEAFVLRGDGCFLVGASEGGHCSFAPRTEEEIALLRYLEGKHGHVSFERVLSGPGLEAIYDFPGLAYPKGAAQADPEIPQVVGQDRAAAVSAAALDGSSARAAAALRLFVSIYGSEAGNIALKYLATGGVYVGGGIAPRILPVLEEGGFMEAFMDKGRFRPMLSAIPVRVILDDQASLHGAAAFAAGLVPR